MMKLFEKYKTHPYAKYFLVLLGILIIYISYNIFVWIRTESTDNAYVDTDISVVSSEISGVITEVYILDNMPVKKGDLIAEIDDRDYKARLAALEASINASMKNIEILDQKILISQTNLLQSRESLDFATADLEFNSTDYQRIKGLKRENFASNKALDESKVAFTKAKTDHNQAKLNLEIAQQNLKLLSLQKNAEEENLKGLLQNKNVTARSLVNTKIIAPVNGVLANSSLQVGNFVSPGRALFFIMQNDKMYVKANFKETQISTFKAGQKAKLRFDSLPDKVIYGIIRNVSPATGSKFSLIPPDNATGNFTKVVQRVPVWIDFETLENTYGAIVPGVSVEVSIRNDQKS